MSRSFFVSYDASGRNVDVAGKATADTSPVEDAVAALEADADTPTQEHVADLRAAWDTLSAVVADTKGAGVAIIFCTSAIPTKDKMNQALRAFMTAMQGSDVLL